MKWWFRWLALALAVLLLPLVAYAQPPVEKIKGKITGVDLQNNEITISDGKEITVKITESTEIKVWGKKPAFIQDLKIGDSVEVKYDPTTGDALEIKVKFEEIKNIRCFFGAIESISADSLVLRTPQGTITLLIDKSTQFWAPHRKREASIADLREGDRVAVLAKQIGEELIAIRVLVIPPKPLHLHFTGVIIKIEDSKVTIQGEEQIIIQVPPGIVKKLKEGNTITIILLKTPGIEKPLFRGGISGKELRERILEQSKRAEKENLKRVEELIERAKERQKEALEKALEKAPEEAKEALRQAIERSQKGWEEAKKTLEKAFKEIQEAPKHATEHPEKGRGEAKRR